MTLLLLASAVMLSGQTKEYIRFNGRVVAIESAGGGGAGSIQVTPDANTTLAPDSVIRFKVLNGDGTVPTGTVNWSTQCDAGGTSGCGTITGTANANEVDYRAPHNLPSIPRLRVRADVGAASDDTIVQLVASAPVLSLAPASSIGAAFGSVQITPSVTGTSGASVLATIQIAPLSGNLKLTAGDPGSTSITVSRVGDGAFPAILYTAPEANWCGRSVVLNGTLAVGSNTNAGSGQAMVSLSLFGAPNIATPGSSVSAGSSVALSATAASWSCPGTPAFTWSLNSTSFGSISGQNWNVGIANTGSVTLRATENSSGLFLDKTISVAAANSPQVSVNTLPALRPGAGGVITATATNVSNPAFTWTQPVPVGTIDSITGNSICFTANSSLGTGQVQVSVNGTSAAATSNVTVSSSGLEASLQLAGPANPILSNSNPVSITGSTPNYCKPVTVTTSVSPANRGTVGGAWPNLSYTPPSNPSANEVVTVTVSANGTQLSNSLQFTLSSGGGGAFLITASPTTMTTPSGSGITLTATNPGGSTEAVAWTIVTNTNPAASVTSVGTNLGFFSPPSSLSGSNIYTVQGTRGGATATIQITVSGTPCNPTVTVSGPATSIQAGQSTTLTASTTCGSSAYTWSMSPSVGSGTANGASYSYTAPGTVSGDTPVTFTASVTNSGVMASAQKTVTVTPVINVSVSSSNSGALYINETRQFNASVTGATNTAVTWSVDGGLGSINSAGVYTAPASIGSGTTATVRATSVASTGSSGTASVSLSPLTVVVSGAGTLGAGASSTYTATITPAGWAGNRGVNWSLSSTAYTSVNASGVVTVAGNVPGSGSTVTLTATSVADATRAGSWGINLTPPALTVTPSAPTVYTALPVQFTAGESVTWSIVSSAGYYDSISSSGLLTPPGTITGTPTGVLRATSTANGARYTDVSYVVKQAITILSVVKSPAAANTLDAVITTNYRSEPGASTIWRTYLRVGDSSATSCNPYYDRSTNTFYMSNDSGGYPALSGASIENSQCILYASGSSGTANGTDLAVTYHIQFKPAYGGTRNVAAYAHGNSYSVNTGNDFQSFGTWAVPLPPAVLDFTPNTPTITLMGGQSQSFAATLSGTATSAVNWSISSSLGYGYGTISASGVYTAPTVVNSGGYVTVTGTSQTTGATKTVSNLIYLSTVPPPPTLTMSPINGSAGAYTATSFSLGVGVPGGADAVANVVLFFGNPDSGATCSVIYEQYYSYGGMISLNPTAGYTPTTSFPGGNGTSNSYCGVQSGGTAGASGNLLALVIPIQVRGVPWNPGGTFNVWMSANNSSSVFMGTWSTY